MQHTVVEESEKNQSDEREAELFILFSLSLWRPLLFVPPLQQLTPQMAAASTNKPDERSDLEIPFHPQIHNAISHGHFSL